jgi:hypothetical protein
MPAYANVFFILMSGKNGLAGTANIPDDVLKNLF